MKKKLTTLLFCGLLYCESNQVVVCQNMNDYVGRYKYTISQDFPSDTTILDLQANGIFTYYPFNVVHISTNNCDSIKGNWTIKRNSIILNSDFQKKDYIKILSKYEKKDSVKIRFVKYPSGHVFWSKTDVLIADNKNKKYFFTESDENGIIVIPKGYKVTMFPFSLIHFSKIPKLRGGYYYQFTSEDCVIDIFENQKFKIHGDTLIMKKKCSTRNKNKRGGKVYYTSKYEYIKIQGD